NSSTRSVSGSSADTAPATRPRPSGPTRSRTASTASRLVPDMMPMYALATEGMWLLRGGNECGVGFLACGEGWPLQQLDVVAVLGDHRFELLALCGIEG